LSFGQALDFLLLLRRYFHAEPDVFLRCHNTMGYNVAARMRCCNAACRAEFYLLPFYFYCISSPFPILF
jgi:hypothetical protein